VTKRSYKVLAAIPKHDGTGEWFMKVGSGYTNRDESINLYIDAVPLGGTKGLRLQIRELDANDIARREAYRANAVPGGRPAESSGMAPPPSSSSSPAGSANESTPF
jgi:hypothetical protein